LEFSSGLEDPLPALLLEISFSISTPVVFGFIAVAVLLMLSAMISGSEVAFFSLSPKEIKRLELSKKKADKLILQLLAVPKELLATILIANNFVNVAVVIISSFITTEMFDFSRHPQLAFLVQVVVVTLILLLIGEVLPKVYATKYSLPMAEIMSYPLLILKKLSAPLIFFLISLTTVIDKKIQKKSTHITVDDLSHALELTTEKDADEEEKKILRGIVKFGNTDVKQIMKSRMDVIAFDIQTSFPELLKKILESGYSRVPVYKDGFDKIEGVLYIKDLLPYLDEKNNFEWQKLIRTPFFVPENKKIDDLLKEFQEKKIHLAIVVDEYGGTSGIVTLEDILEEIVGEITDEFDDEDLIYSKIDENNYVFEGKVPLKDLYRVLDIEEKLFEDNKGDSDTLAGFILEHAGRIPAKNEILEFGNFIFTIESADKRRIKQIKVTIKETQSAE
jgi:putative hemolysin